MIQQRFRRSAIALATGLAALAAVPVASTPAYAQSFNIDFDMATSSPGKGGGVPSNAFGAAANQTGAWNSISPTSPGPLPLLDLNGNATSVTISASSPDGLDGIAFDNPANTGDFALLFNDAASIGSLFDGGVRTQTFSGLLNGLYHVYTYGSPPQGTDGQLLVNIPGSDEGTLMTSGVMTPDTFELGVTHIVHTFQVIDGTLTIELTRMPGTPGAYLNGLQLVLVPAPSALVLLLLVPFSRSRRRT